MHADPEVHRARARFQCTRILRWIAYSPFRTQPTAPLERMSSVPARRSSRKPDSSVVASRSRFSGSTARFRRKFMVTRVTAANSVNTPPTAGVLEEERTEDAEDQQDVGEDADDELGEEVGELGHVAVDALDQVARRGVVVVAHVQGDAVRGEIRAQLVGGLPREVLPDVRRGHAETLLDEGDEDVQGGEEDEARSGRARERPVDDPADQLRVDELHRDAGADEDGEEHERGHALAEVSLEDFPVAAEGDACTAGNFLIRHPPCIPERTNLGNRARRRAAGAPPASSARGSEPSTRTRLRSCGPRW